MLGHVFIAKVYINSNIEIDIKVVMYYFQSLKWKRKKKKEYGLDFSFKYLQKRNIRKEKQPSSPARYRSLARINTPFLRWLAIARPPQSFPYPKTRLLSGIIPNYKKRRHTSPHDIPTEESYPPYPPFLKTWQFPNLKNSTFHCRHAPSAINAVELI